MSSKLFYWQFFILLLICGNSFAGCFYPPHDKKVCLFGRVVYNNSYLPNARLALFKNDTLIEKSTADSNAIFRFYNLPSGKYVIKAVTQYGDRLISVPTIVNTHLYTDTFYCDSFLLVSTVSNTDTPLKNNIDKIVIYKQKRELWAYAEGMLLKKYRVSLGFTPVGAKHFEGDGKTPEGKYHVSMKKPQSLYHKALLVSYPNADDIKHAAEHSKRTGGDIEIHGSISNLASEQAEYEKIDWTAGCIALTNAHIDEIFAKTALNTAIEIYP
ncbi:MAG: hypothetical protein EBX41_00505 [Chitinophagia bacterium]|nr:hypothetical protein [Chitinophagia bacterium]